MARSFNGTTDKVITSAVATTAITNISMSVWVNTTSTAGTQGFLSNGFGNASGFAMGSSGGTLRVAKNGVGGINFTGFSLTTNVWTHVGVLFSNLGNSVLFLNGLLKTTVSSGSGTLTPVTGVAIGSDNVNFFPGKLADAAIWNVTLTAMEMAGLGAGIRPFNIRAPNLVGWWPVDGLASPEPDLSGFKNNGTVTGTALAFGPPYAPFTPRWPMGAILPAPVPPTLMAQILM